jgi:hypothetical protein
MALITDLDINMFLTGDPPPRAQDSEVGAMSVPLLSAFFTRIDFCVGKIEKYPFEKVIFPLR